MVCQVLHKSFQVGSFKVTALVFPPLYNTGEWIPSAGSPAGGRIT